MGALRTKMIEEMKLRNASNIKVLSLLQSPCNSLYEPRIGVRKEEHSQPLTKPIT